VSDSGECDWEWLEQFHEVIGGRLAFHVGGEGQNNLGKFLFLDPLEEFLYPEIVGADVIKRRDPAA
jgi:hypothetical protein